MTHKHCPWRVIWSLLVGSLSWSMIANGAEGVNSENWKEWPAKEGLKHWRLGSAKTEGSGGWREVNGVGLNASNPRLLVATGQGGSVVIVNGDAGNAEDLSSKFEHGDIEAHIEFMIAERSNSGIYFMGRYEVQVLDSFGKENPGKHDCGAIYERWDPKRGKGKEGFEGHPARVNASRKPGVWQSFDVTFRAPRFSESGAKVENAKFIKVVHNGTIVHENVEVTGPTRGGMNTEVAKGPLRLQGDHGPVAYRNIRIRALK